MSSRYRSNSMRGGRSTLRIRMASSPWCASRTSKCHTSRNSAASVLANGSSSSTTSNLSGTAGLLRDREFHGEAGPPGILRLRIDLPLMGLDDLLDEVEPQAVAAQAPPLDAGGFGREVRHEDLAEVLLLDA